MIDDLFKFPLVMVDGDEHEKKQTFGSSEMDVIIGEAEVPYYDFLSITDRWLPNADSLQKASDTGIFDACYVLFAHTGGFIVPWPKDKFKTKLRDFIKKREESLPKTTVKILGKKELKEYLDSMPDEDTKTNKHE